jgi:protein SCO1/2
MNKELKKSIPILVVFVLFSIGMVATIMHFLTPVKVLPVFNPADVNPDLVDKSLQDVKKYHTIADFRLFDQNGDTITQDTYKNKIYVADFFFTTCQTICPKMSSNMMVLQEKYKNDSDIRLLSHSVTPVQDSVPVLRNYADQMGAIDSVWHLCTAEKKHIYELARKSYFAVLDKGDGGAQDFIHTENFILVDKKRRIRGFYDGTDSKDIELLMQDIATLRKEYK